jgi:hypothetical protein
MTRVSQCPISLRSEHPVLLDIFNISQDRKFTSCEWCTSELALKEVTAGFADERIKKLHFLTL